MLTVSNLTRHFGKLTAVNGVSFDVRQGEIRGLIGPNGSGKTTLFNLISGFIPPSTGQVSFNGSRISGLAPHAIARRGLVRTFQISKVYGELTVAENIHMGMHLSRERRSSADEQGDRLTGRSFSNDRADEILDFIGLGAEADRLAAVLPGGNLRKLSIGIALAAGPRLLLLDEPLAGLNASEKSEIADRIRDLRNRGLSILLIEHDMKSVMSLCDRLVVLNFGSKIAEGTAEEIQKNPAVIQSYIGSGHGHSA